MLFASLLVHFVFFFLCSSPIAEATRSFIDDRGNEIKLDDSITAPTFVAGAMDAVSLYHLGVPQSQLKGTYGERRASGSNAGSKYFDGNVNKDQLGDHSAAEYVKELFPADPNAEEMKYIETNTVDLSPSCSYSNYYCDSVDLALIAAMDPPPNLFIVGPYYETLPAVKNTTYTDLLASKGIKVVLMNLKSNVDGAPETQVPRSMVQEIERFEELATFLGVKDVKKNTEADRKAFCTSASDFRAAAKSAQDKGIRILGGYLPFGNITADQTTTAYFQVVEQDAVLSMMEELGAPILHTNNEGTSFFASNKQFSAKKPQTDSGIDLLVDFWLYDDRTTLDFRSDEFATMWPHPAVTAKQYSGFSSNARIFSFRFASEQLDHVTGPLNKAKKVIDTATKCSKAPEGGFSGDKHRQQGLEAGQYACYEPVMYAELCGGGVTSGAAVAGRMMGVVAAFMVAVSFLLL